MVGRAVEFYDVVYFAQCAVAFCAGVVNGQIGGEQLGVRGVGEPVGEQVFGVFAECVAVAG